MDRKWLGMLLVAAFPVSSFAFSQAQPVTPSSGLGPSFNNKSQLRGLIEAGIIF